jgi:exodeoxyribonuclease X
MIDALPAVLAGQALAVVDVEGNGQQPPDIVEIAVLPVNAPTPVHPDAMRTWLVRPAKPITAMVTGKVHGIDNDTVADCPTWAEIAAEVRQVLDGRVLVAHHAHVERRVLSAHLPDWRPAMVLDTLRLAKHVWPGLPSYSLDTLIAAGHIDTTELVDQRRHRAGFDTWCTWQLLYTLLHQSTLTWAGLADVAALAGPAPSPGDGLW